MPTHEAISLMQLYHEYTDTTGVPLTSDRSKLESTRDIDFDYQPCPFDNSPSRFPNGQPHETPISGLERRRLAQHYHEMLSIVSSMRQEFFSDDTSTDLPEEHFSARELRGVLRGMMFLPSYLVWRADEPFDDLGGLPPAVTILSNSAAGSLGALEAYLQKYGESQIMLKREPIPSKMVREAEKSGAMVGEKTVCAASPDQMQHFFTFVIQGGNIRDQFDYSSLLRPGELPRVLVYGEHLYEARDLIGRFGRLDYLTSEQVIKAKKHERKKEPVKGLIDSYVLQSEVILDNLNTRQRVINRALEREGESLDLTLDDFTSLGFRMPGILIQQVANH